MARIAGMLGAVTHKAQQTLDIDPLYDPIWAIFIYAGWALLSWMVDDTLGLISLVASTMGLALFALRGDADKATSRNENSIRSFAADFSSVLLFCAAAIGGGVLLLRALAAPPELLLSSLLFAAAAAILIALGLDQVRIGR